MPRASILVILARNFKPLFAILSLDLLIVLVGFLLRQAGLHTILSQIAPILLFLHAFLMPVALPLYLASKNYQVARDAQEGHPWVYIVALAVAAIGGNIALVLMETTLLHTLNLSIGQRLDDAISINDVIYYFTGVIKGDVSETWIAARLLLGVAMGVTFIAGIILWSRLRASHSSMLGPGDRRKSTE